MFAVKIGSPVSIFVAINVYQFLLKKIFPGNSSQLIILLHMLFGSFHINSSMKKNIRLSGPVYRPNGIITNISITESF